MMLVTCFGVGDMAEISGAIGRVAQPDGVSLMLYS